MKPLNHIRITCLIIFCGCLINTGLAQVEAIVKGKVVNENGTPVKNASVKLSNSDARTNTNGIFVAKSTDFPAKLTVKHTLYSEYSDIIVLPERWRDTIRVFVILSGKEKELEEVTISAQKIFWVYPRKQANVVDFILQKNDQIVLCCSEQNTYYLRVLNSTGEKNSEAVIRKDPRGLFSSCMETIHIIYPDSIYETAAMNQSIGFFEPTTPEEFFPLQSCVYKDPKTLIRANYSKMDQRIEYLAIDIPSRKSKLMYIGEDRDRTLDLASYRNDNKLNEAQLMSNNLLQLSIARERWDNNRFYDQVLGKPVYVPLFEVNDSLIIFDHLSDSAVVFTKEGVRVRSYPIFYQYFNGWKNELITNLEKTKIYARYEQDGLTTLREINPQNGKTERIITLEKHIFPEHLQIHGDFIYYLYKDYLDQSMHYLYKQPLKE